MTAIEQKSRPTLRGHLAIARFDHWIKNIFVLPGVVIAMMADPSRDWRTIVVPAVVGLLSVGFIASANYVINELLDAAFDRLHPTKRDRPIPRGEVNVAVAYWQYLFLLVLGIFLGSLVSMPFMWTVAGLAAMGIVYNVRPIRSKEIAYVDVLSEAINNPIRMLAGWYIVDPPAFPPASLLLSYWMVGCYFMGLKRFAELRNINDRATAIAYRRSFRHYDATRLLVSINFYAAAAMLFFGAFAMRYRLELILAFPLVALVMAVYFAIAFKPDSAAESPEKLYREPALVVSVLLCGAVMSVLCFVRIPVLHDVFAPTAPVDRVISPR